ncbi:MAG TPA: hypothetical protein VK442_06390 [Xanthobacteraceae bacterium]|nr:hypothetical protein [Xanthobacteraceae bacterium]
MRPAATVIPLAYPMGGAQPCGSKTDILDIPSPEHGPIAAIAARVLNVKREPFNAALSIGYMHASPFELYGPVAAAFIDLNQGEAAKFCEKNPFRAGFRGAA